jgi:CHAD domain-containing protein
MSTMHVWRFAVHVPLTFMKATSSPKRFAATCSLCVKLLVCWGVCRDLTLPSQNWNGISRRHGDAPRRTDKKRSAPGVPSVRSPLRHCSSGWTAQNIRCFVADFLAFCRTPGAGIVDMQPQPGKKVTPFQVRHVAPAMLVANFERVCAYEVWFDLPGAVPVETLHRLRIECKYLRYNLEFMAGLLGAESAGVIALLRKLQDNLGDLNDAGGQPGSSCQSTPPAMKGLSIAMSRIRRRSSTS